MASVVGSGIFNAVAFSAAGWLFSHLDHKGYSKEVRRHNLAMENLAKEEKAWRERRDQELDRLSRLRNDRMDALHAEKNTDDQFALWRQVNQNTKEEKEKVMQRFEKERPLLKYTPSKEMDQILSYTKGVLLTSGLMGLAYFFVV